MCRFFDEIAMHCCFNLKRRLFINKQSTYSVYIKCFRSLVFRGIIIMGAAIFFPYKYIRRVLPRFSGWVQEVASGQSISIFFPYKNNCLYFIITDETPSFPYLCGHGVWSVRWLCYAVPMFDERRPTTERMSQPLLWIRMHKSTVSAQMLWTWLYTPTVLYNAWLNCEYIDVVNKINLHVQMNLMTWGYWHFCFCFVVVVVVVVFREGGGYFRSFKKDLWMNILASYMSYRPYFGQLMAVTIFEVIVMIFTRLLFFYHQRNSPLHAKGAVNSWPAINTHFHSIK